jgi:predicted TIM-barrel fold metal-dependent hydrolase
MKAIDAHVHVFNTIKGFNGKGELCPIGQGKAVWANGELVNMIPEGLGEESFLADTCYRLLKNNGVERAVLLQGSFYGYDNAYIAKAVAAYPDMFIGAGTYDPMGMYADKIYDRITNEYEMKILKFETSTGCGLMSYHGTFDIAEVFAPVAKKCVKNMQTMVLDIGSPGMGSFQPEAIAKIARDNPKLKLVVCHLMAPTLKPDDEEALKHGLEQLNLPNVYFDLAAVPFNVRPEKYPYPTGTKYVSIAKEIVGSNKLIWGTDIPSVLCYDSYQELMTYLDTSNIFTKEELEGVLYTNALTAYPFKKYKY